MTGFAERHGGCCKGQCASAYERGRVAQREAVLAGELEREQAHWHDEGSINAQKARCRALVRSLGLSLARSRAGTPYPSAHREGGPVRLTTPGDHPRA